jgi:hypothetical protein
MPGAGILFTCIYKERLYFLLGRENKYCVNGKYTYCDFGGGVDPNETQLETAARECSEEMRGFLGNYNELLSLLKKINPYYVDNRDYRIYIVPIPYLSYLPIIYNNNSLLTSDYFKKSLLSKSKILEKDKMIWYSIDGNGRIPLRKFFKESMKKIQNEKVEIMNYVRTNLPQTIHYFHKYNSCDKNTKNKKIIKTKKVLRRVGKNTRKRRFT